MLPIKKKKPATRYTEYPNIPRPEHYKSHPGHPLVNVGDHEGSTTLGGVAHLHVQVGAAPVRADAVLCAGCFHRQLKRN